MSLRFRLLASVLAVVPAFARAQDRVFDTWKVIDQQYGYRVAADTQVVHGGAASGHVTALGPTATVSMFVSQAISAEQYRGKRVRFSAFLRARNAATSPGKGAVLFIRAEGNGATLASYSTGNRPVGGNAEWTKKQIVIDIPATTLGITLGFGMGGPGEMWMDDATLEVVDESVEVSKTFGKPPLPDRVKARQQEKAYAGAPKQPLNMDFEKVK